MNRTTGLKGIGLALLGVLLAGCSGMTAGLPATLGIGAQEQPAATRTAVAETGTVETYIVATGKVTARQDAALSFPRSGQVAALYVKEGDAVRAGQPLAALDAAELDLAAQQQYAAYLNALAAYTQTVKGPDEAQLKSARAQLTSAQAAYADLNRPPGDNEVAALTAGLMNAEADLKQAQSRYDNANRRDPAGIGGTKEALDLEKATNAYNLARANYDRAFEKAKAGALAGASAQIAAAKAQIDALQPVTETIQQAEARRDQARLAWQQADLAARRATLVAPFDGTVTRITFDAGDWMTAGAPAIDVAQLSSPWFEMNVDEADLGQVRPGDAARVMLQAHPDQPIAATVESIAASGSSSGSVVTFRVRLALPAAAIQAPAAATGASTPPAALLGMSGTAEIITGRVDHALTVPNQALVADRDTRAISVQKIGADGRPAMTPVEIGLRGASTTQIVGGLAAGDQVIINSADSQGR